MTVNNMKNAIEYRLNSDSWDLKIASSVIARRSVLQESFLLKGSFVSMSAAALSVFVLALNIYITGTVGSVTNPDLSQGYILSADEYSFDNDRVSSEISTLINETYPMR